MEWHNGGGGQGHLVGLTELGWMLKGDPTTALSVLYGLGRWEVGRGGEGEGWTRRNATQGLGEGRGGGGGVQQQQQQQAE